MPDKPLWLDRLPAAIQQLTERSEVWVDRTALESALGVGRRRAQQLLAQIPNRQVGASMVADRADVIAHLERIAASEDVHYERRRQQRLWGKLSEAAPPVLVEVAESARRRVEALDFEGLPEGVELAPGRITVRFGNPEEALRKLMALALAIGRNRAAFEELVRLSNL
jgi:hypothetical protein